MSGSDAPSQPSAQLKSGGQPVSQSFGICEMLLQVAQLTELTPVSQMPQMPQATKSTKVTQQRDGGDVQPSKMWPNYIDAGTSLSQWTPAWMHVVRPIRRRPSATMFGSGPEHTCAPAFAPVLAAASASTAVPTVVSGRVLTPVPGVLPRASTSAWVPVANSDGDTLPQVIFLQARIQSGCAASNEPPLCVKVSCSPFVNKSMFDELVAYCKYDSTGERFMARARMRLNNAPVCGAVLVHVHRSADPTQVASSSQVRDWYQAAAATDAPLRSLMRYGEIVHHRVFV